MHYDSEDFSLGLRIVGSKSLYLENLVIVLYKNIKGYVIINVTIHYPIFKIQEYNILRK